MQNRSNYRRKKVLFTFGLSSCIGIYLCTNNFGILGHIDPGDMFDTHFEHEYVQKNGKWTKITKGFKQSSEIMYKIKKNIGKINKPIKIGIVVGTCAEITSQEALRKITTAIKIISRMIRGLGIEVEEEPIKSSYAIVDTIKDKVILDKVVLESYGEESIGNRKKHIL